MSLAYSATRLQALHVLLADWLTGVALLAFSVLVFLCFTPVLTFVNSAIVEERQVRLASTHAIENPCPGHGIREGETK